MEGMSFKQTQGKLPRYQSLHLFRWPCERCEVEYLLAFVLRLVSSPAVDEMSLCIDMFFGISYCVYHGHSDQSISDGATRKPGLYRRFSILNWFKPSQRLRFCRERPCQGSRTNSRFAVSERLKIRREIDEASFLTIIPVASAHAVPASEIYRGSVNHDGKSWMVLVQTRQMNTDSGHQPCRACFPIT